MKVLPRIVAGLSILIISVFAALLLQSLFISRLRDVSLDLKDNKLPAVQNTRDLNQQMERLNRASVMLTSLSWQDPAFQNLSNQFGVLVDARDEISAKIEGLEQFVASLDQSAEMEDCQLAPALKDVVDRFQPYVVFAQEVEASFPQGRRPSDLEDLADDADDQFKVATDHLSVAIDCVVEASVGNSVDQAESAVRVSTALIALAISASLWAGIWMVRSITGPLRALTRAHRKWMREDFAHQVDVKPSRKDEFGELARSGNAMSQRLGELEELKRDFLSHVSHELKSPLNAIQSSAQMLLRDDSGAFTPRQKRRLELMIENGERLSKNILNLLDYSRLEAGVFSYEFEGQDLVPIVHRYLEGVEPAVLEQGLRLEKRIPVGTPVMVRCDAERVLQVVGNLVDNALKFSPPKSALAVRLEVREDAPDSLASPPQSSGPFALISVIDSGPGVPHDQRESIFTKFHQVKGSRKGVGLGLAICRKMIEAHRGRIWYEDNPEGGAIFRVLLPIGERRQEAAGRRQEEGEIPSPESGSQGRRQGNSVNPV